MTAVIPLKSPHDLRSEQLADEITELYSLITAATYDFLVKVREFDEDELWAGPGLMSCAHWLNWKCGIGMNAAREKVRVARALPALPKISEAFRLGKVSYSKVRAMTRVADEENEDYLLNIALHGTASMLETLVRSYRRAVKLNEPESAEIQHDSREFNYWWDENGCFVFKGRLPAEVGTMLMKAIEKGTEQVVRDVASEMLDPFDKQRADALAMLAESYLEHGPASSSSADRYQVMVHVSAETSGADHYIEHGPDVSAETSKRICCDTSISKITEDEEGEPLSIGRKSRVIPPAMRRALKARDKQCRFPGCTHRYFIDGHHIHHWSEGGETSLDNLVQLCRYHHRLVHEGGFICCKNHDNKVEFRTPAGALIPASGDYDRCFRGNAGPRLQKQLEEREIHAQTIIPEWYGEAMDLDLAVALLWDIDHPDQFADIHASLGLMDTADVSAET